MENKIKPFVNTNSSNFTTGSENKEEDDKKDEQPVGFFQLSEIKSGDGIIVEGFNYKDKADKEPNGLFQELEVKDKDEHSIINTDNINFIEQYNTLQASESKTLMQEIDYLIKDKNMSKVIDNLKSLSVESKIELESYCNKVLEKENHPKRPIAMFCLGYMKLLDTTTAVQGIELLNSDFVSAFGESYRDLTGYALYLCGKYSEDNKQSCYEWYEDASEDYGNIESMLRLGTIALDEEDNINAEEWLNRIILIENIDSNFKTEAIIKLGIVSFEKNDKNKAEALFRDVILIEGIDEQLDLDVEDLEDQPFFDEKSEKNPIVLFCLGCIAILNTNTEIAERGISLLNDSAPFISKFSQFHRELAGYALYLCGRYKQTSEYDNHEEVYWCYHDALNVYGNLLAKARLKTL
ncbi:MAG: tetratricopeptide repeat protein [Neisseriaceae bacterium]